MKKMKATLKKKQRVAVKFMAGLTITLIVATGLLVKEINNIKESVKDNYIESQLILNNFNNENLNLSQDQDFKSLEELRKVKLPTYTDIVNGVECSFVKEEDLIEYSKQMSKAVEQYFKSCGATNWANEESEQFWPEDIEYLVVAIAFQESSYRTDYINDEGCGGLLGLNKKDVLNTINSWVTNKAVWEDKMPNINCNYNEVDLFDPAKSIEYAYYLMGYKLANFYKNDKQFYHNGEYKNLWEKSKANYSEELQEKWLTASWLFGDTNVINSIYGVQQEGHTINDYLNSKYVKSINEKKEELKNIYEVHDELGY